jgi:hypothetical protein
MEREKLAARIQEIGFSCTRCGACCQGTSVDDNLVMVYPREIAGLAACAGSAPRDFTEPYPETVLTEQGGCITFEWCLKRTPEGCIFLDGVRCRVYGARPWICRTYPFMLSGDDLVIAPCEGLGSALTLEEARDLADLLIARKDAELTEEERVRAVLSSRTIPPGKKVLVDGTGIMVL